ncbi:hypothetical protein [Poriferisphaera sp. WC338]|uniref:hypothetical protein n=1 Tax=Poriferisphaera sp. WC338 TaxID=3425129 RepID=UPI003D81368E
MRKLEAVFGGVVSAICVAVTCGTVFCCVVQGAEVKDAAEKKTAESPIKPEAAKPEKNAEKQEALKDSSSTKSATAESKEKLRGKIARLQAQVTAMKLSGMGEAMVKLVHDDGTLRSDQGEVARADVAKIGEQAGVIVKDDQVARDQRMQAAMLSVRAQYALARDVSQEKEDSSKQARRIGLLRSAARDMSKIGGRDVEAMARYWQLQAALLEKDAGATTTDKQGHAVYLMEMAASDLEKLVMDQAKENESVGPMVAKDVLEQVQLGLLALYQQCGMTEKGMMLFEELRAGWGEDDMRLAGFGAMEVMGELLGEPLDVKVALDTTGRIWESTKHADKVQLLVVSEADDVVGDRLRDAAFEQVKAELGTQGMADLVVVRVVLDVEGKDDKITSMVDARWRRVMVRASGARAQQTLTEISAGSLPWVIVAEKGGKVRHVGQSESAVLRVLDVAGRNRKSAVGANAAMDQKKTKIE